MGINRALGRRVYVEANVATRLCDKEVSCGRALCLPWISTADPQANQLPSTSKKAEITSSTSTAKQ